MEKDLFLWDVKEANYFTSRHIPREKDHEYYYRNTLEEAFADIRNFLKKVEYLKINWIEERDEWNWREKDEKSANTDINV